MNGTKGSEEKIGGQTSFHTSGDFQIAVLTEFHLNFEK